MLEQNKSCLLPWGPYSKKYMGLSRVMAESRIPGARFDLAVHPTYANSAVPVPNVCVPSGYHPWDADADGTCYTYRYELIWKDQLYTELSFFQMTPDTWGIRAEYVNHTDLPQNCLLNFFSAIEYPSQYVWEIDLPEKNDFWDARNYHAFSFAKPKPWNHLTPDGYHRGEIKVPEFTEERGLGALSSDQPFGSLAGDSVIYRRKLQKGYTDALLTIRYRTVSDQSDVTFASTYGPLLLKGTRIPDTVTLSLGRLEKGDFLFQMTAQGTEENGVELDFFCITEREEAGKIFVRQRPLDCMPQIRKTISQDCGRTIRYQYANGEKPIYLSVFWDRIRDRELASGCLEDALSTRLSNSDETYDDLTKSFSGSFSRRHSDDGFYHNQVLEAIFVPPQSTCEIYAAIGTGPIPGRTEIERCWRERQCRRISDDGIQSAGKPFAFSVRLLKAVLFSNVVYPIERHGQPVIHYTPGKRWDSLYTWDSGFIGIGMSEYSAERAEYIMDLYLSEEENPDFAFLFHGSMVPTQFFLWHVLFQKTFGKDREALKRYYPMFRRYYRYFAGKTEGSTTARYQSGILTPYDYFYNAGGMDDYPAQVALHRQKLENQAAPVCTSAFLVRIAKIMKMAARYCGQEEDIPEYDEDIRHVSEALLKYAWDEESGYFGYVLHDNEGNARSILRTPEGENYNKGNDGVTPLIAGIGTESQTRRMLEHLRSEQELWSPAGVSSVDMSASYYYDNGYWNGSVWFPYQYMLWKSMLDLGEGDLAYAIVQRALEVWKKETEFSYNTFEMIQIKTGRGGWYHQFGGLSAPICSFFGAYFKKGTVTAGFDTWVEDVIIEEGTGCMNITYRQESGKNGILLAVLEEAESYEVWLDGQKLCCQEHVKGTLEIPLTLAQGKILIRPLEKNDGFRGKGERENE